MDLDSSGTLSKVLNTIIAAMKDNNTEPQAIMAATVCGNRLTLSATSRNPINGNNGIRINTVLRLTISNDSEYQYQ